MKFGRDFGVPLDLAALTTQTFIRAREAYGGGNGRPRSSSCSRTRWARICAPWVFRRNSEWKFPALPTSGAPVPRGAASVASDGPASAGAVRQPASFLARISKSRLFLSKPFQNSFGGFVGISKGYKNEKPQEVTPKRW